jgi:hypothetical protein
MAFLQIRGDNNIPKFALLPYDLYKSGTGTCELAQDGYTFTPNPTPSTKRFGEMFTRGDSFNWVSAVPKAQVPESVDALVQECKDQFDEILVAWEADWQPRKGDPIVIGRIGGYYYIVATWDMTELESFVASTMVE